MSLPDGIYNIYPLGFSKGPIKTYCDMNRDGGGWTLLVTSHTNEWTKANVDFKNVDKPSLINDYSILKYADYIKNELNIVGTKFEYRLEAQRPGKYMVMLLEFCPSYLCSSIYRSYRLLLDIFDDTSFWCFQFYCISNT